MQHSAYDYALTLLSYNPKTTYDMRTRLMSKWYNLDDVNYTIDKLTEQDYLNDAMFAQAYIRSEVINKGKALRTMIAKLRQKGIDQTIIKDTIADMDEEINESTTENLLKEIRKLHNLGHDIITIYTKLTRKWHNYDNIKKALETLKD